MESNQTDAEKVDTTPPNLLFIYTDEQSFNTLAAYGNDQIEMPNLDRLAEQSMVFDRAYVSQPVCTASRSTILTGLYPHQSGMVENNTPLRPEIQCLPEMLAADYATAHVGKWHLGDELFAQHGFSEWVSMEDGYTPHFTPGRDKETTSSYHDFLIEKGLRPREGTRFGRGEAARFPEELGKPAFLAREASRFIRDNAHRPFVLYVNFLEPHMPFFGPRDDQYDPTEIPLPANFAELDDSQPLKARIFAAAYRELGHDGMSLQTPEQWQRMIANYWGLCSLIDTYTGTILDTLDDCGLGDNTIVVFTSDHGDMMGSHRLLAKCVMFEEAVRVPLLLRMPGQKGGRRVRGPVSQIDLVPTLLDLLSQPLPGHLGGKSLRPLIEGDETSSDCDVFIEWNGGNSGVVGEGDGAFLVPSALRGAVSPDQVAEAVADPVRTVVTPDGWKLNQSRRGDHELYNLTNDPGELSNLYGREDSRPVIADLRERIVQWQQRTGDAVDLSVD